MAEDHAFIGVGECHLRGPGVVVESPRNRAEEKPLTLWPLLEDSKVSQTGSESRDTRVAQTLTQTKAIQIWCLLQRRLWGMRMKRSPHPPLGPPGSARPLSMRINWYQSR
jgi:hypothetical protein